MCKVCKSNVVSEFYLSLYFFFFLLLFNNIRDMLQLELSGD